MGFDENQHEELMSYRSRAETWREPTHKNNDSPNASIRTDSSKLSRLQRLATQNPTTLLQRMQTKPQFAAAGH